jgi:NitT/TauT family transport system permease protein
VSAEADRRAERRPAPPRRRARGAWAERGILLGLRVAIVAVVLAAWQIAVSLEPDWEFWVSKPSLIWEELTEIVPTAAFWEDVYVTLQEVVLGFVLGAVAGIASGFLLGYFKRAYVVLQPLIFALYSLPRVALVPLFILWFGIGLTSKIAIVISVVFFILLMNTYFGVQAIDRDLVNNVRTMGASRFMIFRHVALPSCASWILSGARISISFALMSAIMAEMVASRAGLGNALLQTAGAFDTTGTFALLVVLGTLAILINAAMQAVHSRLLRWQDAGSGAGW